MKKVDMSLISNLLQKELKTRGVREICRSLKISPSSFYNFKEELGQPKSVTLERIARYFGKDINDFFHDTENHQQSITLPALTIDEVQLLDLYRKLCEKGHGQDLLFFGKYTLDMINGVVDTAIKNKEDPKKL